MTLTRQESTNFTAEPPVCSTARRRVWRLHAQGARAEQIRKLRPLLGLEKSMNPAEGCRDRRLDTLHALDALCRGGLRLCLIERIGRDDIGQRCSRSSMVDRGLRSLGFQFA